MSGTSHGYAKQYTDADLLADIRSVADDLGKYPTQSLYTEHGEAHVNTVKNRFGTWNDAIRRAKLPEAVEDDRGDFEPRVTVGMAYTLSKIDAWDGEEWPTDT